MKKYFGFVGLVLLFISSILPIASLNADWITIFPIFNNFELQGRIWEWRDISTFAVTYPIILILITFFYIKNKSKVVLPLIGVLFFMLFFVLVSLWMTNVKVVDLAGYSFSFSFGWIVILIGLILLIAGSIPDKKSS